MICHGDASIRDENPALFLLSIYFAIPTSVSSTLFSAQGHVTKNSIANYIHYPPGRLEMKYLRRPVASVVIFTLSFLILAAQDTYAYIAPGTGSYLLPLMLAGLLGLAFTMKIYWQKIKMFFLKLFRMRQHKGKDD